MKIKGPARLPEPSTPSPEFGRWFFCHNCHPKEGPAIPITGRMTIAEAMAHLREKHGLNASGGDPGGTCRVLMHGDGPNSSVWVYVWKVGEVTLSEHECQPRRPLR